MDGLKPCRADVLGARQMTDRVGSVTGPGQDGGMRLVRPAVL